MTSQLIGRFCPSGMDSHPAPSTAPDPLTRYDADLVVPAGDRARDRRDEGPGDHVRDDHATSASRSTSASSESCTDLVRAAGTRPATATWSRCSPPTGATRRTTPAACAWSSTRSPRSPTPRRDGLARSGSSAAGPAQLVHCPQRPAVVLPDGAGAAGRRALDWDMAGLIKREDIDEVRQRTDIKEVVDGYVTLKSAGVGSFKGLCPFHDERSRRRSTSARRSGTYHCFGCGEGGDVISFVQKMDHTTFTETVERLAARIGYRAALRGRRARPAPRGRRPAPAAARRAQDRRGVLPRAAAHTGERADRPATSSPSAASTRPPRPALRRRATPPRAGTGCSSTCADAGFPDDELKLTGMFSEGNRGHLRPVPRPADLAHPRPHRRHDRFRRPQAVRGRPGAEVPEHPGDPRSTRSPRCSTASTSPSGRSPSTASSSWSRATPT